MVLLSPWDFSPSPGSLVQAAAVVRNATVVLGIVAFGLQGWEQVGELGPGPGSQSEVMSVAF